VSEVGFTDDPNLPILIAVAQALGDLRESFVFVGGCATGLLLTARRAQVIRATQDVDVVVQVASLAKYHEIERAVQSRGFKHDLSPEAPICRWIKDGVKLDLMPSEPGILGFHNRWYPMAVKTAKRVKLPGGIEIKLIIAPAFHGRGESDYLASHDLEDLVTVIDGRLELIEEIQHAEEELQRYLASEINKLLTSADFRQALSGHLPGDAASQARLPELLRRMRVLAELNVHQK
jgi:hypothetical protein